MTRVQIAIWAQRITEGLKYIAFGLTGLAFWMNPLVFLIIATAMYALSAVAHWFRLNEVMNSTVSRNRSVVLEDENVTVYKGPSSEENETSNNFKNLLYFEAGLCAVGGLIILVAPNLVAPLAAIVGFGLVTALSTLLRYVSRQPTAENDERKVSERVLNLMGLGQTLLVLGLCFQWAAFLGLTTFISPLVSGIIFGSLFVVGLGCSVFYHGSDFAAPSLKGFTSVEEMANSDSNIDDDDDFIDRMAPDNTSWCAKYCACLSRNKDKPASGTESLSSMPTGDQKSRCPSWLSFSIFGTSAKSRSGGYVNINENDEVDIYNQHHEFID